MDGCITLHQSLGEEKGARRRKARVLDTENKGFPSHAQLLFFPSPFGLRERTKRIAKHTDPIDNATPRGAYQSPNEMICSLKGIGEKGFVQFVRSFSEKREDTQRHGWLASFVVWLFFPFLNPIWMSTASIFLPSLAARAHPHTENKPLWPEKWKQKNGGLARVRSNQISSFSSPVTPTGHRLFIALSFQEKAGQKIETQFHSWVNVLGVQAGKQFFYKKKVACFWAEIQFGIFTHSCDYVQKREWDQILLCQFLREFVTRIFLIQRFRSFDFIVSLSI